MKMVRGVKQRLKVTDVLKGKNINAAIKQYDKRYAYIGQIKLL